MAMVSEVPLRYGRVAIIVNLPMTFTNVGIQTNWKKSVKNSTNLLLSGSLSRSAVAKIYGVYIR